MFGRDTAGILGIFESLIPSEAYSEGTGELPASLELGFEGYPQEESIPFETEGSIEETPSRYLSSGGLRVESESSYGLHEVRFVEKDGGGYALEGSHLRPVDERVVAFVSSRETLKEYVSSALDTVSERLGAEVSVSVRDHTVRREELEGSTLVNVDYRVSLDGLARLVRTDAGNLTVNEATVSVSRGDETRAIWEFDLRNHAKLATVVLAGRGYEDAETVRDLRRRSDFAERVDWETERDETFSGSLSYDTKNAERYYRTLESRGIQAPAETAFEFETDSRGATTTGSFDFETNAHVSAGVGTRLESWTPFLPFPFDSLAFYFS